MQRLLVCGRNQAGIQHLVLKVDVLEAGQLAKLASLTEASPKQHILRRVRSAVAKMYNVVQGRNSGEPATGDARVE